MNTTFDYSKYCELVDDFLIKMEKCTSLKAQNTTDALRGVCDFLRVAKLELMFYENIETEKLAQGQHIVVYSKDIDDKSSHTFQRKVTEDGRVIYCTAYQAVNAEPWSDNELKEINVILKMLFVFNSRMKTLSDDETVSIYDSELGTYNFPYFIKYATKLIASGKISNYTACYFDIKRFTSVKLQVGHSIASKIMRFFVNKVNSCLGENDIICRVGGDTFVALFDNDKLGAVMPCLEGINVDYDTGKTIFVSATAGFYHIPNTVTLPGQIMDCVSSALTAAKHILSQQFVFYKEELQERINNYRELEKLFPLAIENEEFQVYYQPKVFLKDYTLIGAEALCRWQHNGEMIMPSRFIPMLEQSKAICTLDFYMLEHVCKDIRDWLDSGHTPVKVSVNFSRCHLGNVNLLSQILEIVNKYHVPHQYVEVELTETTTDVDFVDLKTIVSGLQNENISTSVDDFGIGYSSLNLIRELPWKVLKIDKSFLSSDGDIQKNNIMLKHVISMAHDLGLECIVEGVETPDQVNLLKENHCFNAQGFYFDRPLPKDEFEKRLFGIHKYN